MAEMITEESQTLESTTVGIYRTATVVKGGRRFSFGALVVVGDRRGNVGLGYGKAPGVPAAIEKAQKNARKNLSHITLKGGTLSHQVTGRFGASLVRLIPAAPGTGVIAGATVRAVLEMAGVRDCLTKSFGSNNQKNLCKAAMHGLLSLRTKGQIEALRGLELDRTEVEQKLEAGQRYMPTSSGDGQRAKAPVNVVGQKSGGGGRRRRGGGGRRSDSNDASRASSQQAAPATAGQAPQAPTTPDVGQPQPTASTEPRDTPTPQNQAPTTEG